MDSAAERFDRERFAQIITESIMRGAMLGAVDSLVERERDEDDPLTQFAGAQAILMKEGTPSTRLPFQEAMDRFRTRNLVSRDVYDALSDAARRKAFTVAGLASEELLGDAHAELQRQIDASREHTFKDPDTGKWVYKGPNLHEFRKHVAKRLESAGWTPSNPSHVETIYRTNVRSAYSSGRLAEMTQPAVLAARPYWQIMTVRDSRQRATHRAAHGIVLPADHPFWRTTGLPPWGFNCRCRWVSRSRRWVDKHGGIGSPPSGLPDPDFTSAGATLVPPEDLEALHGQAADARTAQAEQSAKEARNARSRAQRTADTAIREKKRSGQADKALEREQKRDAPRTPSALERKRARVAQLEREKLVAEQKAKQAREQLNRRRLEAEEAARRAREQVAAAAARRAGYVSAGTPAPSTAARATMSAFRATASAEELNAQRLAISKLPRTLPEDEAIALIEATGAKIPIEVAMRHPRMVAALRRLEVTEWSHPLAKKATEELARMDPSMLHRVANSTAAGDFNGVFIGARPLPQLDELRRLAGVRPRGWQPGTTWDIVGGCADDNQVAIAVTGQSGSASTALHEFGHLMGARIRVGSAVLDDSAELVEHHARLYDKLQPYLQQDGPGGLAGRQEMLAESIAELHTVSEARFDAIYDGEYREWLRKILATE